MNEENIHDIILVKKIINAVKSVIVNYWEIFLDQYGIPLGSVCIKLAYAIYTHFSLFNVMLFLIKYIPPWIFMYKFIKIFYVTSRERMTLKKSEVEEVQLQIQIAKTKLSLREADIAEREQFLKRDIKKFCQVRARVRQIIVNDRELRTYYHEGSALLNDSPNSNCNNTSDEESKFIIELLRTLKYDDIVIPDLHSKMLSCGEHSREIENSENSVYSSASDLDATKRDCHIKKVKVTKVYRVAYLRQFFKQKRLRRTNKQALLKKKTESIKKLLDNWQKTLSIVINKKLSLLDTEAPQIEVASQEAMGDYSKPNFYNSSDSDSDFRNSTDNCHDDYNSNWIQNQYEPIYTYNNYEAKDFFGDSATAREYYDVRYYKKYD